MAIGVVVVVAALLADVVLLIVGVADADADVFAATADADVTDAVVAVNAVAAEKPVVYTFPAAAIVVLATVVGGSPFRAVTSSAAIVPHPA